MVAPLRLDALTLPVEGQDPADVLWSALDDLAESAPIRVVDNGIGLTNAWGFTSLDADVTVELTGDDLPRHILLIGLRPDDDVPERSEADAERDTGQGRRTIGGVVRVRASLVERVADVATYVVEVGS